MIFVLFYQWKMNSTTFLNSSQHLGRNKIFGWNTPGIWRSSSSRWWGWRRSWTWPASRSSDRHDLHSDKLVIGFNLTHVSGGWLHPSKFIHPFRFLCLVWFDVRSNLDWFLLTLTFPTSDLITNLEVLLKSYFPMCLYWVMEGRWYTRRK